MENLETEIAVVIANLNYTVAAGAVNELCGPSDLAALRIVVG
jgi:hypothetical protein